MKLQTISILVKNKSGVLAEVSKIFAKNDLNIESLAVGTTSSDDISRITVKFFADDNSLDLLISSLSSMPFLIKVKILSDDAFIERHLAFIKVKATTETRGQIREISEIFHARIIDLSPNALIIEITGTADKIKALTDMVKDFGILEIVKTGAIAVERGESVL